MTNILKIIREPAAGSDINSKSGRQLSKIDVDNGLLSNKTLLKIDADNVQKPLQMIVTDSSGVDSKKLVREAGLDVNHEELQATMKEYGVTMTKENLMIAAEHAKLLPDGAKNNLELLSILVARKLPTEAYDGVLAFLQGKLRFANMFAAVDAAKLDALRNGWQKGQMLDALQMMLKEGASGNLEKTGKLATLFESVARELGFQELASILPTVSSEGQIFFRWPFFWDGQNLPDTLEGEAYVPDKENAGQGFSLKLLVNPPNLGQMTINLNSIKQQLWIKFGVEEQTLMPIKTIYEPIREQILKLGDYEMVHIEAKVQKPVKNCFVKNVEPEKPPKATSTINIKA